MPDTYIRSVGTALPGPPIDNAALARRFNQGAVWQQWVESFVGTRVRHLALDLETGEQRSSLADLGEAAARRALSGAGVDAASVDLVVMGTATPDALMPATVNLIADRLGINEVPAYQLQSGCTGAVQALDVARQMLLTGRHRTALVLGGDVCAKHFDVNLDLAGRPPAEQVNGVLFGDGAGAAVMSVDPGAGLPLRIEHVLLRLTGMNRPPGQVVDWFGMADRGDERPGVLEDYKAIEESVPDMAVEILEEMLADLDWKRSELAYLLPPQLSGRMTQRISERMAVPDAREVSCVADTGNNGNALPFLQLEQALPLMSPGDRSVLVAVESSKWIKAGLAFEAG
ncbi:3-oxoacyl-ACP synthase III family protein [Actinomadura sp. DC4]|uniref:3-oxoacyl-ACP synthase III family protein n=1 Tax=Actinomadura sp. DC4 TaxID=3055069 RepID=UPI0025B06468|nr:3-oxoacyl-ACP synthase III family protein [Actinomadura sp. DC4]MDN3359001.1 3-oxoacyl-ACP synthase III family protein [Actinomadura sp. DC4]